MRMFRISTNHQVCHHSQRSRLLRSVYEVFPSDIDNKLDECYLAQVETTTEPNTQDLAEELMKSFCGAHERMPLTTARYVGNFNCILFLYQTRWSTMLYKDVRVNRMVLCFTTTRQHPLDAHLATI